MPNTSPTAGSSGADLNGMAVKVGDKNVIVGNLTIQEIMINNKIACEKLVKRLEPIKAANPNGTWQEWVHSAFDNRVSLCASGFYK